MRVLTQTLKDLASPFDADFLKPFKELNGDNTLLYALTYGEADIDVSPLLPYVKDKSYVIELFAGAGMESYELATDRPNASFNCLDLHIPFKKPNYKNVRHTIHNVLDDFSSLRSSKPDLIFIGGANASLACMSTLSEIDTLFKNVSSCLPNKGVFACSSYAPDYTDSIWVTHYETYTIRHYKEFIGYTAKVFHLHYYDDSVGCMNMFHLLNLYDKKGKLKQSIHNTEGYKSHPYSQKVVVELAQKNNFTFEKNNGQYNIFRKQ